MNIQEIHQIVETIVKKLGGKVSYINGLQIVDICESLEERYNEALKQHLKD